jgi:hypothetical protein
MAVFELNQPIVTEGANIIVDPGLKPGQHRFQLIVEDVQGNRSLPSERVVTVVERDNPAAPPRFNLLRRLFG